MNWDANLDGAVTISDIWLLLEWLICLPGNFFLNLIRGKMPTFAGFFEISADSEYGAAAWVISIVLWLIVIGTAMTFASETLGQKQ